MKKEHQEFAKLFNEYRLKAQFETLSQFGEAMHKEGVSFEDSVYSRWKNGYRIPRSRTVLLAIIKIFIKRGAIATQIEADHFLLIAHHSKLQSREIHWLFQNTYHYPSANSEHTIQFTEEDALYLAIKILGKPFTQINMDKIQRLYKRNKHALHQFIQILKHLEIYPETIKDMLDNSDTSIIRDKNSYKYALHYSAVYIRNLLPDIFPVRIVTR